jgi:hypothetical protein
MVGRTFRDRPKLVRPNSGLQRGSHEDNGTSVLKSHADSACLASNARKSLIPYRLSLIPYLLACLIYNICLASNAYQTSNDGLLSTH